MFAEERQNRIVELVEKNGSVRVKNLSEQFGVTEDCIRKDLTALQKKGLLRKTYGGAVQAKINEHNLDVRQRRDVNTEEKQRIAQSAMRLLNDGDMVFLDISTANLELARLIAKSSLRITVVTNMIDILAEFQKPTIAQLVFVGGRLNPGFDGFVGAQTIDRIVNYRFDTAFMGVVGVDVLCNEVTTYEIEDGLTKKAAIDHSRHSYMMLETVKFHMQADYKYATVDDFSGIICDAPPPDELLEKLKSFGIECIY